MLVGYYLRCGDGMYVANVFFSWISLPDFPENLSSKKLQGTTQSG